MNPEDLLKRLKEQGIDSAAINRTLLAVIAIMVNAYVEEIKETMVNAIDNLREMGTESPEFKMAISWLGLSFERLEDIKSLIIDYLPKE